MAASFSASWLAQDEKALALLPDRVKDPAARRAAVEAAVTRRVSPQLLEVLKAQNASLPPSPQRERHLEALGRVGTAVVVTGQQLGLFLGPLFTIYKAAAAITAARALSEESGHEVVPLFWLQTEDHDLPEIDHCFIPGRQGPVKLELGVPGATDARAPVCHQHLGPGVLEALKLAREHLGGEPFADEHLKRIAAAYRPEARMVDAFAQVLASLFVDEGLVLFNPRDERVGPLVAPFHRQALSLARPISKALSERSRQLSDSGFSEQVHIRTNAPLAFFSPDELNGPRYRLDPQSEKEWALVGHPERRTVTAAQLEDALQREPLRFTTSALLRPPMQDTLLPTAAYVGGPGEIAYFAQLQPLYDLLKVPMPLVVHRARFRVIDDRAQKLLGTLGLSANDVCGPREPLLQRLAEKLGSQTETPSQMQDRVTALLHDELRKLDPTLTAVDPVLKQALEKTEQSVRTGVAKLASKYGRALVLRENVSLERLNRVRDQLFPFDAPQERIYALLYYGCRFGGRVFVQQVLDACVPYSGTLKDLRP